MQSEVATWTMPLGGMRLLYIRQSAEQIIIGVETDSGPAMCSKCASTEIVGYGRMNLGIRDLPIQGRNVLLDVKRRRLRCQQCNKTFNEPIPNISEHHRATERLVTQIGTMALSRPFSAVSREMGMDEKTIRMIFSDLLEQMKVLPSPRIPESLVLWTPLVLRDQRAVWVNHAECTLVAVDPDTKPGTVKATLQQFRAAGGAVTLFVPPDPLVIKAAQEFEGLLLKPHIGALRKECARIFENRLANRENEKYASALHRYFQAKSEQEAAALWTALPLPPADLRTRLRNMLAAIEMLGPTCLISVSKQDQASDAKLDILGGLLSSGFSRRSYDVVYAVMMLDTRLRKTRRATNHQSGKAALPGYEKTDFGTSISKLINRLKDMDIDAGVDSS